MPYFFRECGKAKLVIDAGTINVDGKSIDACLPWGSLPRLILLNLFSRAVRYKTKKVNLGESTADFMRQLGLRPTGGKRGNYSNLKNQLNSLYDRFGQFSYHS